MNSLTGGCLTTPGEPTCFEGHGIRSMGKSCRLISAMSNGWPTGHMQPPWLLPAPLTIAGDKQCRLLIARRLCWSRCYCAGDQGMAQKEEAFLHWKMPLPYDITERTVRDSLQGGGGVRAIALMLKMLLTAACLPTKLSPLQGVL